MWKITEKTLINIVITYLCSFSYLWIIRLSIYILNMLMENEKDFRYKEIFSG